MSIRVTFDSDESTTGFAAKHGLPTPTGNSLDVNFHLLEQATKDATVSVVAQTDETEHEFLVKGTQSAIEVHATVVSDMGRGWFKVTSTAGAELAKVVDAIDVNSQPIDYLAVSSIANTEVTNSELDPLSAEGQWARIRVASKYRPLMTSYSMHDMTAVSKPELYIMDSGIDFTHPEFDSARIR